METTIKRKAGRPTATTASSDFLVERQRRISRQFRERKAKRERELEVAAQNCVCGAFGPSATGAQDRIEQLETENAALKSQLEQLMQLTPSASSFSSVSSLSSPGQAFTVPSPSSTWTMPFWPSFNSPIHRSNNFNLNTSKKLIAEAPVLQLIATLNTGIVKQKLSNIPEFGNHSDSVAFLVCMFEKFTSIMNHVGPGDDIACEGEDLLQRPEYSVIAFEMSLRMPEFATKCPSPVTKKLVQAAMNEAKLEHRMHVHGVLYNQVPPLLV